MLMLASLYFVVLLYLEYLERKLFKVKMKQHHKRFYLYGKTIPEMDMR
jgi:hypothetical protein